MRPRAEILRDIISLSAPLPGLRHELRQYGWDSTERLVALRAEDIVRVLRRFVAGELTAHDVAEWAEALEMRDDIEVNDDRTKDALFDLANPALQGSLTVVGAEHLIGRLKTLP